MARIRSPNYPQIGLAAAIERTRAIYKAERHNRFDRDTAVRLMGFGGYNGASAGVLSALSKYGLLENAGEKEMKVSDLAARILSPHDDKERARAIKEASGNPPLFVELAERWPDTPPSAPSLQAYLTRRGFADSALESVMKSYRETLTLVAEVAPQYQSDTQEDHGVDDVDTNLGEQEPPRRAPPPPPSPVSVGPGLNLVRTDSGYIVQLSGAVLTQGHVDEVVTLLTALKASMPASVPEATEATEH